LVSGTGNSKMNTVPTLYYSCNIRPIILLKVFWS